MFSIGLTKIVLVFLVAFVIVGPKDLPKVVLWTWDVPFRCACVTADVAKKTVALLNAHFGL